MDTLRIDLRHACRSLAHARAFSLSAWLILTFGIGLSTTVAALVNGVLLDPLPYPDAERLVRVSEQRAEGLMKGDTGVVSDVGIGAWIAATTPLQHISPYSTFSASVILPSATADVRIVDVGREFFSAIATTPIAGRVLVADDLDAGAAPVAVVSERVARQVFGDVTSAIGRTVGIDYANYAIVGVLPATYGFPDPECDIWRPGFQFRRPPVPGETRQMGFSAQVVAQLRPGASLADAERTGAVVAESLANATSDGALRMTFHVRRLLDEIVAPVRTALVVLAAGTVIVVFAAAVSLANLLLARTTARQREMAVRLALGGGRWRAGRPVLIELLLISAAGAIGSAALAWALLRILPALAPGDLPRIESIHFDVRTPIFALCASILVVLGAGWLPVWRLSRTNVRGLTGPDGRVAVSGTIRSGDRVRGWLAASQIAIAVVLVVAAFLVGRSLSALLHVNLGYRPDGVLAFQAAQPLLTSREPGRLSNYYRTLLERLRTAPGVESVGQVSSLPMHPVGSRSSVSIVGHPPEPLKSPDDMALRQYVSTDYFRTLGTRIVQGRALAATDNATSERVMLVDEVLARRYFPDGDAIGHQIRAGVWTGTIVGVVEAVRYGAPGEPPRPVMYFPAEQSAEYLAYFHTGIAVKTSGDPRDLVPFVREVAHDIDPNVSIFNLRPLTEDLGTKVAGPRFFTIVTGLFAVLALSTALLGLYGVLAYAVERRRREFGIRQALGATRRHVSALVMRWAASYAGAGVIVGLVFAALGARFMRALLFGITPADPLSFVGAAAVVLVVVVAASLQPLRQALQIDVASTLRVE